MAGPLGIANCVLWLDATQGVYLDGGHTLAAPGNPVQQWNDQSGTGPSPIFATNTLGQQFQPIYDAQNYNGLPSLRFFQPNSLPKFMDVLYSSTGGAEPIVAPPCTIVLVWSSPSIADQLVLAVGGGGSLDNPVPWYIGSQSAYLVAGVSSTTGFVSQRAAPFWPGGVFNCCFVSTGSVAAFYVNGVNQTTNASFAGLGGTIGLGKEGFAGDFADVLEIAIYNRALIPTEISNLNAYLVTKWGSGTPRPTPTPTPTPASTLLVSTATSLTTSPNPSLAGQQVELTATVTITGPNPIGYQLSGNVLFGTGPTILGTVPIGPAGVAILITTSLLAGNSVIGAVYQGSPQFSLSQSLSVTQTVQLPTPTPTPTPGPITTPLALANCVLWLDANQNVYTGSPGAPPGPGNPLATPGDVVYQWGDNSPYQALVINNKPNGGALLGNSSSPFFVQRQFGPVTKYAVEMFLDSIDPNFRAAPAWLDVVYDGPIFNQVGGHYTGPLGSPLGIFSNIPATVFVAFSPRNYGEWSVLGLSDSTWGAVGGSGQFFLDPSASPMSSGDVWGISVANSIDCGSNIPQSLLSFGLAPGPQPGNPVAINGGVYSCAYVTTAFNASFSVNGVNFTGNQQDVTFTGYALCVGGASTTNYVDIFEIVVYNRALLPTEQVQVTNYLMQKWGTGTVNAVWNAQAQGEIILAASASRELLGLGTATATIVLHAAAAHTTRWATAAAAQIILSASARGPTSRPVSANSMIILAAAGSVTREYPVSSVADLILSVTARGPMSFSVSAGSTITLSASAFTNDQSVQFASATIILSAVCVPSRPPPPGIAFRAPTEVIRPVRRRSPWVHGPLPYVVYVHAQAGASLILSASASQAAVRVFPASGEASIILAPLASCHGDASPFGEASIILRARARTVFPEIDYGDDYLGRFQQGDEVPLWVIVRDAFGEPTDPTAEA